MNFMQAQCGCAAGVNALESTVCAAFSLLFPFAQFLFRYVNFTFLWSHTVFVHVYFAFAWLRCRKIKVVFFCILSFNAFLFKRWSVYSLPFVRCARSFYSQLYFIFFCISHSEWIFRAKKELCSNEQPNWMNSNVKTSIVVITHHHHQQKLELF